MVTTPKLPRLPGLPEPPELPPLPPLPPAPNVVADDALGMVERGLGAIKTGIEKGPIDMVDSVISTTRKNLRGRK